MWRAHGNPSKAWRYTRQSDERSDERSMEVAHRGQTPCPLASGRYCGPVQKFENGLPGRHIFSSKLCAAENVTPHIQFGMAFLHSCRVCLCCAARRARMNCKSKNLCIVVEVASVRAVGGKSLISVVILVENSFRSSNGRVSVQAMFPNRRSCQPWI